MKQQGRTLMAGALVGFLGAVGIYFEPREPYQHFIVIAGTIGGSLLALMISAVVDHTSSLMVAIMWGALLGFLQGAVIFLSKGGWVSWDAPFVVPTLVASGIILGPIVRRLNISRTNTHGSRGDEARNPEGRV